MKLNKHCSKVNLNGWSKVQFASSVDFAWLMMVETTTFAALQIHSK
jgi:hypothetical protein